MSVKNKKSAIYLPIIFSLLLVAGILIGLNLRNGAVNERVFIHPRSNNKLINVINYIHEEYVDSVSKNEMVENTIPKILEDLDPHSVYIPAKRLKRVNEPLEGNFEGIGIQFNMTNDTVVVISTISGGPSEKVGIQPGDRIIKVEDSLVAGQDIPNTGIVKLLKGPKGTKVNVSIKRKNVEDLMEFEITRDEIPLYSVDAAYKIRDSTGYIKISKFARTTYDEYMEALYKLKGKGINALIIDLRGNGGGYMDAATKIANDFLHDDQLIVYTEGKSSPRKNFYADDSGNWQDKDLVILIDEWSASASEILAGAIQDNDRGTIIGRRSFGKGLVQQQTVFPDGSALRLTVARYYTPTGRCIQKPYENGKENYFNDLNERYRNGEFEERDSIKFADSLKYSTPEGDIVYGGGGIMPDIFVPMDTTGNTAYYQKVTNKGLVYKFAFEYADSHRPELNKYKEPDAMQEYLESINILNQFASFARENGINEPFTTDPDSRKLLSTQIKAYIARNIIDNEGFYPIIREIDETLQKGIEFIKD